MAIKALDYVYGICPKEGEHVNVRKCAKCAYYIRYTGSSRHIVCACPLEEYYALSNVFDDIYST